MSTIIVPSILTSSLIVICLLLIAIEKKHLKKKLNTLLLRFSKIGSENDLIFSSQEILVDVILGLDGIKRKLLVFNKVDPKCYFIIDLLQVVGCSVQKHSINNELNATSSTKKKETERIALHFEFMERREPLDVLFYSAMTYSAGSIEEMEQKARDWEIMLSKLMDNRKKTA